MQFLLIRISLCVAGLRAKPSDKSIFSPSVCNCWCTMWAEIHVRSPTGDLSWIMRVQNDDQDLTSSSFPDLPLANISSLLRGTIDHTDEFEQLLGDDKKIDSWSLQENEYETLLEEHFNLPATGGSESSSSRFHLIVGVAAADTILLQPVLSRASSSVVLITLVSRLALSIHLCFGLPLSLLPGGTIARVLLPT